MSAFDKIIGYEDIKAELIRFCDVLKNPEKYEKLGVTLPRGILLAGEPGLGKTLMATSFIEESGRKSFILRKDKPDGDFVKEIKRVFEEAKKEPYSIVFLDDMDKFANEDMEHRDAEEYVAIQACIDETKGKKVFVLATVNDLYSLPDSLKRSGRFDKTIEVEIPVGNDAKKIIEYYLEQKKLAENVDSEEIARLMVYHSCADLETVINEAGIYAAFENRINVNQDDIRRACLRNIYGSPEIIATEKRKFIKDIAVHEAGHAAVAELLDAGSVSLVTIHGNTGEKGGITIYKKDESYSYLADIREYDVVRTLGGKAATEVVYGRVDMGCEGDVRKAFSKVNEFMDDLCATTFASKEFGCSSGYTREELTRRRVYKLEELYTRAKRLIIENREFFDAMVEELLEKETLTYKDIAEIRKKMQV